MISGRMRAPTILVAVLIAAAALFAAIPSASAAASTAPTKKPKLGAVSPPPSPSTAAVEDRGVRSSSVVFPLHGDVYPRGLYYVAMSIGEPPKPYFLDVDTGSDLTWLQCDAPCVSCTQGPHPLYKPSRNKLVPCHDPLCMSIQSATKVDGTTVYDDKNECESPQQCDYEIAYADHGSSIGVLVSDAFALRLTNGSIARPHLAFGCGYDQQPATGSSAHAPTDGVLGLGSGKAGVMSQLSAMGLTRNVIGHCLSRRGGGYLFFGDDLVPASGLIWAPMSRSKLRNLYSPGQSALYFGKQSLGGKRQQMVFDSGSSFTYFASQPYQALLNAVRKELSGKPLKETYEDPTLPVCWKGPKPLRSILEVRKYFKSLILIFANGKKAFMEIPPENYLITTKHGNACLGILNGTEIGLEDLNIIGDISLQDLMVVYDNEKQQLGWVRANCDRLPNADGSDDYEKNNWKHQLASMGVIPEQCPALYDA